jgi:uncharacterized protein YndB with AHSA1/START domain
MPDTNTKANTVNVTVPNDREIVVTRAFDAPRSLVWECHTSPELVRRWMLGPDGWTMPVCDIDLRVGGGYRHVWRNDADGSHFGFQGKYKEIVAPERLVHSERWDGAQGGDEVDAQCTLTLVERGGRTTLTYSMVFPSKDVRDQALQSGMTDGMAAGYDRLDTLMAERSRRA